MGDRGVHKEYARRGGKARGRGRPQKAEKNEGWEYSCVQINLNRCHAAHDVLECLVREWGAHLVMASEYNSSRAGGGWYTDMEGGDRKSVV